MMNEKSKERFPGTSILKQKHKSALDVDITGSYFESTPTAKANKRVSFKRVSFIKPFISDVDDKNTIWDNTYEEEVNHTDSTPSHQETITQKSDQSARDDLNSTKLIHDESEEETVSQTDNHEKENQQMRDTLLCNESMEFTQPVGISLRRPNKTLLSDISMDLTRLPIVDKENMFIGETPGLKNRVSILTFAKRSENCSNVVSNGAVFRHSPASIQIHNIKARNEKVTANIECVRPINDLPQTTLKDVDLNEIPMDLSFNTQAEDMEISYYDIDGLKEANSDLANIEPEIHNNVENKINTHTKTNRSPFTAINPICDSSTLTQDFPLTSDLLNKAGVYRSGVPVCSSINSCNTKTTIGETNKLNTLNTIPQTSIENASAALGQATIKDMDFTCSGFRNADLNLPTGTQDIETNMELTGQIPETLIAKGIEILDESMEFTCKMTQIYSSTYNLATNSENINKNVFGENEENVNNIHNYVPKINNDNESNNYISNNLNSSDTRILNESMQFTCKLPPLKISVNNTRMKCHEKTEINKENINPVNYAIKSCSRTVDMKCAGEEFRIDKISLDALKQIVPLEENMEVLESDIQIDNESMQLTCKFPVVTNLQRDTTSVNSLVHESSKQVDKENINPFETLDIRSRKNLKGIDNETVCSFSKRLEQNMNIHLSKQIEDTDMELTCQIPKIHSSHTENIQILDESMQLTCRFPPLNSLPHNNSTLLSNTHTMKSNNEAIKIKTFTASNLLQQTDKSDSQIILKQSQLTLNENTNLLKVPVGSSIHSTEGNKVELLYCVSKQTNTVSQPEVLNLVNEENGKPTCIPNCKKESTCDKILNESMDFTCKFTTVQHPMVKDLVPQKDNDLIKHEKEHFKAAGCNIASNLETSRQLVLTKDTINIDSKCMQSEDVIITNKRSPLCLKRHHETSNPCDVNVLNESAVSACKVPRLDTPVETPTTNRRLQNKDETLINNKQVINFSSHIPLPRLALEMENGLSNTEPLHVSEDFVEQCDVDSSDKKNHASQEYPVSKFLHEYSNIHINKDKHALSELSIQKNNLEDVQQNVYMTNSCSTADQIQDTMCAGKQNMSICAQPLTDNSVSVLNYTKSNISLAASYNFDLKSMSSCIDDTQKLINLSLSRPSKEISNRSSFGLHSTDTIPCQMTENPPSLPRIDDTQFEISTNPYIQEEIVRDTHKIRDMLPQISAAHDCSTVDTYKLKDLDNSSMCVPQVIIESVPNYVTDTSNKVGVTEIKDGDSIVKNDGSHVETLHLSNRQCISDLQNCSAKIDSENKTVSAEFTQNISDESSILLDIIDLDVSSEDSDILARTSKCFSKDLKQVIRDIKLEKCCFTELKFKSNISEILSSKGINWLNSRFNRIQIEPIKILSLREIYEANEELSESSTSELVPTDNAGTNLHEIKLPPKPSSLLEKICDIEKRCTPYWKFDKEENDKYFFSTLYDTLQLVVQCTSEGVIWDVQIINNLSDNAQPLSKYVHRLFIDNLNKRNLESTLGMRYDILAFLDYVYLTMQNMLEFMSSLEELKMVMDSSNNVTLKIIDIDLIINWVIQIDVTDMKNVGPENVTLHVKTVPYVFLHNSKDYVQRHENILKGFVNQCPKGLRFLKVFREQLDEYIKLLSKRAKFASNSVGKN